MPAHKSLGFYVTDRVFASDSKLGIGHPRKKATRDRITEHAMADKRNIEINKSIVQASGLAQVLAITKREPAALNLVNCVTALGVFATVQRFD